MKQLEAAAIELAALNGRDWTDMGAYERQDYIDEAQRNEDRASAVAEWGSEEAAIEIKYLRSQVRNLEAALDRAALS